MVQLTVASTIAHLKGILALQKENLPEALATEEAKIEGFVTVDHSLEDLKKISGTWQHIIGLDEEKVISYALVMVAESKDDIPILAPFFPIIDDGIKRFYNNDSYIIMGQICVDKAYRKQGLFAAMYTRLMSQVNGSFDQLITIVATKNIRSMNAHKHVGFQEMRISEKYQNEDWRIIIYPLS